MKIPDFDNHVDPESICAGIIDFSDIITEKEISSNNRFNPTGIGQCKVQIYGNEGDIPHFHIEGVGSDFDCCVRIYEANFFQHGTHCDILNSKQCSELDIWLRSKTNRNISRWIEICAFWEAYNPDCRYQEYKKATHQPAYYNMNSIKLD